MSRLGHPRVITHNVSSLDGRLSLPGVLLLHGDQRWSAIAGDAATDMWALHQPQAQLEGSNSFVAPDAPAAVLPSAPGGVHLHTDFLPGHIAGPAGGSLLSQMAAAGSGGPRRLASAKST